MTAAVEPDLPSHYAARTRRLQLQAAAGALAAVLAAAALAAAAARACVPRQLLCAWLVAEAAFVFVWRAKLRHLNQVPPDHRPPRHDGAATADRFYRLRHFFPFSEGYLRPWFRGAPLHQIRRGNVLDLLSYGFHYRTTAELEARGELPALEQMVDSLIRETGLDIQSGRTPGLPMMSHLQDQLPASFRPLAFYVFTEALGLLGRAMMWSAGFDRHVVGGAVYYTFPGCRDPVGVDGGDAYAYGAPAGAGAAPRRAPVLLLHGVGAGVLPYLGLILQFAGTGRPMVVPEFRHVSMRLTAEIPSVEQLAAGAAAFLQLLGHGEAHVVGHSYGTLVASRLAQLHPKRVASLALLDPVCFGMFQPALLKTFLYSFPDSGSFITDFGLYLVSRELHMTATFCRGFFWSDYNLWPEFLPRHTLVSLSGKDRLCEPSDVRCWLESETSAGVIWDPDRRHGDILLRPAQQRELLVRWAAVAAAGEAAAGEGEEAEFAAVSAFASAAAEAAAGEQEEGGLAAARGGWLLPAGASHARSGSMSSSASGSSGSGGADDADDAGGWALAGACCGGGGDAAVLRSAATAPAALVAAGAAGKEAAGGGLGLAAAAPVARSQRRAAEAARRRIAESLEALELSLTRQLRARRPAARG